jgi:hypothetical protein
MKSWHPNSNKHKAAHGGYNGKPAKKDVLALLDLYNVANQMAKVRAVRQEKGTQLKLEL